VLREVAAVLADAGADEAQRAAELRQIYKRRIEDPVDLLRRHKLLVVPPKERHSYRPTPFPAEQRRELDRLVQRLLAVDKERLLSKGPRDSAVDLMREIGEGLAGEEPLLADRVRQAVQRGCGNLRASHAPPSVGR
jgi:hypothetical protein